MTSESELIDGVAVNNENWNRYWNEQQMRDYMDALARIKEEAEKQVVILC